MPLLLWSMKVYYNQFLSFYLALFIVLSTVYYYCIWFLPSLHLINSLLILSTLQKEDRVKISFWVLFVSSLSGNSILRRVCCPVMQFNDLILKYNWHGSYIFWWHASIMKLSHMIRWLYIGVGKNFEMVKENNSNNFEIAILRTVRTVV